MKKICVFLLLVMGVFFFPLMKVSATSGTLYFSPAGKTDSQALSLFSAYLSSPSSFYVFTNKTSVNLSNPPVTFPSDFRIEIIPKSGVTYANGIYTITANTSKLILINFFPLDVVGNMYYYSSIFMFNSQSTSYAQHGSFSVVDSSFSGSTEVYTTTITTPPPPTTTTRPIQTYTVNTAYVPWDTDTLLDLDGRIKNSIQLSVNVGFSILAIILGIYVMIRIVKIFENTSSGGG